MSITLGTVLGARCILPPEKTNYHWIQFDYCAERLSQCSDDSEEHILLINLISDLAHIVAYQEEQIELLSTSTPPERKEDE